MSKTKTDGNVVTNGKTPVDIGAIVADQMKGWDTDELLEQAAVEGDETAESEVGEPDAEQDTEAEEEAPEMSEDSEDAEPETEEKSEEGEETEESEETADDYSDGTAGALRFLEDNKDKFPPSVVKALQSLQGELTRVTTDRATKEKDLDAKLEKVEALLSQIEETRDQTQEPDPADPINRVSPEQEELFRRLADKLGYVKQETLDKKDETSKLQTYQSQLNKEAVTEFGEDYGTVDGEIVTLNPQAAEAIHGEYERLADPVRGATERDLFILANYKSLIEKAKEKAVEDYRATVAEKTTKRVQQRKDAATVTGTKAPGAVVPKIKVEKNDPNRFDKVMDQAIALGLTSMKKVV